MPVHSVAARSSLQIRVPALFRLPDVRRTRLPALWDGGMAVRLVVFASAGDPTRDELVGDRTDPLVKVLRDKGHPRQFLGVSRSGASAVAGHPAEAHAADPTPLKASEIIDASSSAVGVRLSYARLTRSSTISSLRAASSVSRSLSENSLPSASPLSRIQPLSFPAF